ncbi:MAG: DUF4197 domain-containing protein [Burkholderiales bacterium]|nr:DUF4197 domain-containing protein [Burkholderiales bacterium]
MTRHLFAPVLLSCLLAANLHATDFTDHEARSGLSETLTKEASDAVGQLGVDNGFYGNPEVKIPLPDSLQKAERVLRSFGMSKQADELELTMNRAAERAVHEAKPILLDAVKKISWEDARAIVTGDETAATEYFRRTTSDPLTKRFQPIVHKATSELKLAEKYNEYAGRGVELGLIKPEDANLDDYVTRKAMEGLFRIMGDEEKAIRKDPMGQASKLLRKIFGGN